MAFAYPNGIPGLDFDEREVNVLADSGIQLAFTTEARPLRREDHKLRIPRIAVSDKESRALLRAKLLLGSRWNKLKMITGRGEQWERLRLSRKLSSVRAGSVTLAT
jgi:hypothetical protein